MLKRRKYRIQIIARSAVTGQFVTVKYAKRFPRKTVIERIRIPV